MKRFSGIVFAALSLAISAVFVAPNAALAHDAVVSTTPADGSTIAPGSIKIAVTFGEPVMATPNNDGIEFQIVEPNGSKQILKCVDVVGVQITSAAEALSAGEYTINWRSVSSDGHANSGAYKFTVADGAQAGEAPGSGSQCLGATPTADPNELDLTTYSPVADASAASNSGGSKLDPIAGLGIGVGLVVILSLLGALSAELQKRRRVRKAAQKKLKAEVEANPDMLRDL